MSTSKNRKISAILFADIVGYTALMQKDEATALQIVEKFRTTLTEKVKQFNGQIINDYGDGCLCTFNTAIEAVDCAEAVQLIFQASPIVPVRIGLHSGAVYYEAGNVYGDSVNIASRIESLGVAGAILFSAKIQKEIASQTNHKVQSLGSFDFKNVAEPMEVFGLANGGMVIPKRSEMQGKLKENNSFLQKLWQKRIPQILGVYIIIAWAGLQLFDWALNQFGISPHWAQIFFITVIGIIPSLLVYLSNKERIQEGELKLREKILFPANFLLVGTTLFLMFRTADLGAMSKDITFLNADGIEVTETIIKEEFRKQFPIFSFDQITPDSTSEWIGIGLPFWLELKLKQNTYLSPGLPQTYDILEGFKSLTTVEKINQSKVWKEDFYIDGKFQVTGETYELIPAVRNKNTGKIIQEKRFIGKDIFSLVDSMSSYLSKAIGLTAQQLEEQLDVGMAEAYTDNVPALKHTVMAVTQFSTKNKELEKAVALDSTFAFAAKNYAKLLHFYGLGQLEAEALINKAMTYRKRLPMQEQIDILVLKHLIYKEWDKAEQLLNIQLEINPTNEAYNQSLSNIYFLTNQLDKLAAHTAQRFSKNPSFETGYFYIQSLLTQGKSAEVIRTVKPFLLLDPQNLFILELLGSAYMHNGDWDAAQATLEKITLFHPDEIPNISKSLEAITYMREHPIDAEYLSQFEGYFRFSNSELVIENRILANQIYNKPPNQQGFFMFPAGPTNLKRGGPRQGFIQNLLFNKKGQVYGLHNIQNNGKKIINGYCFKQDSSILKAEALLKAKDYQNALPTYQKAVEQHPEHFYLQQALQHLDYRQSQSPENLQQQFQKLVGTYDNIEIWIENGLLYYKRPGVARRILRPISNNRFTTLLNYSFNYEFVEKAGKIVGIQGINYNHETKEWEKIDDWYYERTELLD